MNTHAIITQPIERVNRFFLLVIVPLLGVLIPNAAGLINNTKYSWWQLLLSYVSFIFISYTIWKGNVHFLRLIRKNNYRQSGPYFRVIFFYFLVNIVYSGITSFLLLALWMHLFVTEGIYWPLLWQTSGVIIVCVVFINNVYELVMLRQEMEDSHLKAEKMEMAKMQAELEALKAQIDPHFIFNSLNTLSYLITNKPDKARYYNETLAKVYRYILMNKDKDLVFLKEELEFISNYFYLIKIRHEDAINMVIEIPDVKAENYLITPISLQILIENAIKHNFFSKQEPLRIEIGVQSNYVIVRNRIRNKEYITYSSGIGLNNLKERYHLITQKYITVDSEDGEFIVNVPILKS